MLNNVQHNHVEIKRNKKNHTCYHLSFVYFNFTQLFPFSSLLNVFDLSIKRMSRRLCTFSVPTKVGRVTKLSRFKFIQEEEHECDHYTP